MKKTLLTLGLTLVGGLGTQLIAQNIFSGERVMVVGAYNGYVTTPYGTDYRTTTYRRVSLNAGTPTDGRGQWATTINIQSSGGDAMPINMAGGAGNGFLFISGPSANRFQNKWVFSGIGQATVDGVNNISAFNSGNDMGLNMNTPGYYTFSFNDCGYTQTNGRFYIGYTAAAPVSVTRSGETLNVDNSATITATTSAAVSAQENVYVRYTTGTDFSGTGTSSIVQASLSGPNYIATIPAQTVGTVVRYYVFSSTRSLAQLTANTELERSLSILRYDDNSGANYIYTVSSLPVNISTFTAIVRKENILLKWVTPQEQENTYYIVEKSTNSLNFYPIGRINVTGPSATPTNYEYVDPSPNIGNNYYRIAGVTASGSKSYSRIFRAIYGKVDNGLTIFPNPASTVLNVRLVALSKGWYDFAIFNDAGQRVFSESFQHNGVEGIRTINLPAHLKKGPYRLVLTGQYEFYKEAFLIQ